MRLILGDCLEKMAEFEEASVDAIVTDPPYGLEFMGKEWDHGLPGVHFWQQALRVAKPGAHLLAFGGTRTFHRLACAIEDAGWEIRDCVMWVYGSGFPKSLDVSKAIDRRRNDNIRPVCRFLRSKMEAGGFVSRDIAPHFGYHPRMVDHWAATDTDSQPTVPTWDQWLKLKELLNFNGEMDAEVWRLNGRKGKPGDAWFEREVVGKGPDYGHEQEKEIEQHFGFKADYNLTAPATDQAKKWSGWGTALKPAWEPIIVARKPLIGTVAENVLEYGTGGINVDGCRVETDGRPLREIDPKETQNNAYAGRVDGSLAGGSKAVGVTSLGRWPANLIHDGSEEVLAGFPVSDHARGNKTAKRMPGSGFWGRADTIENGNPGDSGSASRFFYCAKASKKDRDEGLNGDGPNRHPTVKPTALMRYVCKLVTPPGGVVLDPFMGSGSTGKAAQLEGFDFIGIEQNGEYFEIAQKRIEHAGATLFAGVIDGTL